jgi:hypothetical protein
MQRIQLCDRRALSRSNHWYGREASLNEGKNVRMTSSKVVHFDVKVNYGKKW